MLSLKFRTILKHFKKLTKVFKVFKFHNKVFLIFRKLLLSNKYLLQFFAGLCLLIILMSVLVAEVVKCLRRQNNIIEVAFVRLYEFSAKITTKFFDSSIHFFNNYRY